jgi:hypothetical protein
VTATGTSGLTNANVELQIFDHSGHAVATNVWSGQNFAAGQTLSYSHTWASSTSVAAGAYTVDLGVFDSAWSHNYYWNGDAAVITVEITAATPTGLTATAGNAQIALKWTADSGANSYNVYRGTKAGGESATPIKTGLTATTFTDTSVTNGTKYFYKVAAVNAVGVSGLSIEVSATPVAPAN